MEITVTELSVNGTNSDANFFNASMSRALAANTLGWAVVLSEHASTTPNTPTASGGGVTWVEVATVTVGLTRLTLFRAMGSSPSGTTITFDFGGQTQGTASWTIVEWDGVDTSGTDGSGAVVQSNTNSASGSGTTLSVSLSAFGDATNNVAYGAFASASNVNCTPGDGFTGFTQGGTTEARHRAEWKTGEDTTVDITYDVSVANRTGLAAEIKAAAGGATGQPADKRFGGIPFARGDSGLWTPRRW